MNPPDAGRIQTGAAATGPPRPHVLTLANPEQLARAVASALTARLAAAQSMHGTASLVLTGGGMGTAVLAQVLTLPSADHQPVDWSAVEVWWSDERFVPADDPQRNELQARRALLDPIGVPEDRVHPMPASASGSVGRRTPLRGTPSGWLPQLRRGSTCPASTCCCWAWAPRDMWPRSFPARRY